MRKLKVPLSDKDIADLKAGEQVSLSGIIYTARDAAHKRMAEALGSLGGQTLIIGDNWRLTR